MSNRSTIAKGSLAAVAGLATLAAGAAIPTFASAQSAGYYGSSGAYYDPCRRAQTNRGTAGALIGGALGAAIGSNAAAGGVRTEGALLGGALGAAIGAGVGNSSAACAPGSRANSYDNNAYNGYYGDGYYSSNAYGYGSGYGSNGYYGSSYDQGRYGYSNSYDRSSYYGSAYDRYGRSYPIAQRPGADGCSVAESPIYMPDGSVQKRFVRVCRDSSGRYQVVD